MCPLLVLCILTVPREGGSVSPHAEDREACQVRSECRACTGEGRSPEMGGNSTSAREKGKHSLSYRRALAGLKISIVHIMC